MTQYLTMTDGYVKHKSLGRFFLGPMTWVGSFPQERVGNTTAGYSRTGGTDLHVFRKMQFLPLASPHSLLVQYLCRDLTQHSWIKKKLFQVYFRVSFFFVCLLVCFSQNIYQFVKGFRKGMILLSADLSPPNHAENGEKMFSHKRKNGTFSRLRIR